MPGDRDASGEKRGAPRRSWRGSDRRHHPGGDQCDLRCHRQAHPHPADRYGTAEILTLITKEALMLNLSRYGLAISLLAAGAVSPEAAHVPLMYAGPGDHGVAGLQCKSCHGDANFATLASSIASIPGHSHWGLAPASMAWQRKSLRAICLQLKDGTRNGGRSLSQIREHMAKDSLVGWAWHPGEGRSPAPGTQAQFGALIRAWIVTGAHCPES